MVSLVLFYRETLRGIINEWVNLVYIASIQGEYLLTVQPGSMEAGLLCEHYFLVIFSKHFFLQKTHLNPCFTHIGLLFVIFQVLNRHPLCRWIWSHQEHAYAKVECRRTDALCVGCQRGATREAPGYTQHLTRLSHLKRRKDP
jgi:hypothetical protein